MDLYAESSAVLAWLLRQPDAVRVRECLASASEVYASELTLIECDRALVREQVTGRLPEAAVAEVRFRLAHGSGHWTILGLSPEIAQRARMPFPIEPIRTLDAIHLASALFTQTVIPGVALLALDGRVRECGRALGLQVLPEEETSEKVHEPVKPYRKAR